MTTICAEHHNKPYSSQQFLKKPFKDLDIPPRKKKSFQDSDMFDSNLHKFLPCDNLKSSDDQDLDPYSSDHFRMYEFKVRRCTRSRSHDWTDCPFAHPGEKARRRDPRKYHYSGTVCPEFRRGECSRGDSCEFAHGVFECWLHPSRYRTEACKDGKNCKRKICFFAHSPRQLRLLPEFSENKKHTHSHCFCLACHSVISSPTSTLLGMSHFSPPLSPSLSPPLSPVKRGCGFSPVSRYSDRFSKLSSGTMSYKDVLNELMSSLEAMNVNDQAAINNTNNIPWIDIGSLNGGDDHQFILSPSTPSGNYFNAGTGTGTGTGDYNSVNRNLRNNFGDYINTNYGGNNGASATAVSDPDLGWVNDLLM